MKPQNMTSILAGVATVLGVVPFLLFFKGEKIRARSKMATSIGFEAEEENQENHILRDFEGEDNGEGGVKPA